MLTALLITVTVAVTGCSSTGGSAAVPSSTVDAATGGANPAATAAETSGTVSIPQQRVYRSMSAPPGETYLILESDGVGLLTGTSVRHYQFGTDLTILSNATSTILGSLSRTTQPTCGQGTRVQLDAKGFSALFSGSSFVGWTDTGTDDPHLTTLRGVGVGSSLATLRSRYPEVKVTDGTLGPEWIAKDGQPGEPRIGGLLDSTSPTGKVTTIYAGETCLFR
ncbi:MAG: hypothetical protein QG622_2816 [Actinomycetota bacterium]|nr:hypothetical protein [Actinomycetota bacterium]